MSSTMVQFARTNWSSRPHWRPCITTAVISFTAIVAGLHVVADWRRPTGPAVGTSLSGSAPVVELTAGRIRVATFNIHHGCGKDGRVDLSRTAATLGNHFDLVGMNEVGGGAWGDSRSQAERLGELMNLNWLYAPTETSFWGPQLGQGIVTRLPVSSWQRVPFPREHGNGYRNYVECQIPLKTNDKTVSLTVLVTHLDRKADRQNQLQAIIERFLKVPPPAILMGDLNSKRTEPQLIRLANEKGVIDCFGLHVNGDLGYRRIDWIFSRGLHCLTSNLESTDASDHPWGWAELALPSAQGLR